MERGRERIRTRTWPAAGAAAAPADALSRFGGGAQFLVERLRYLLAAEIAQAQLLPWIAISFGAGVVLYFAASREPLAVVVVPVAVVAATAALLLRRSRLFAAAVLTAALLAGFATATVRAVLAQHEVLVRPLYSVSLAGFVETHEERERSDRFILRVVRMDDLRASRKQKTPALSRVRLSVKKGTAPAVGSFVELKAGLSAPLSPLRPGSYDFARDLYFQGVGATGLVHGSIKSVTAPEAGGLWLQYAVVVNTLRDAIDGRIRQSLSGDSRAIASALLTGKRDAITAPVNDAMFISGLGHVLSISGYHMAVVAGIVFFVVRALLALFPSLTTAFPIKKVAAGAALVIALLYLLLSGSEVATQRSFIMTAVVLIAVIVDRRAITFRTLAIAALAVLILAPEAIVHPSFQMSFAATLGLVALMQGGLPTFSVKRENSVAARVALWGGREILALLFASMVAGLATTPYAAFHFHRAAPYGILANLLAMPIVSAWVMPTGLFGVLAIPFGFDGLFWQMMDGGIAWMVAVSLWVAALPGSVGHIASFGTGPLLLATAGVLLLGLLRTPLRWAGAIVASLAAIWALAVRQPDILIAADGGSVAARTADGRLRTMQLRKDAFLVREWLAADGDGRLPTDPSVGEGAACDPSGCALRLADGAYVTLAQRPDAFVEDCRRAAIIVTWRRPPKDCAAKVIDRKALQTTGSLALWREGGTVRLEAARPQGSDRPWAHSNDAGARLLLSPEPAAPAYPSAETEADGGDAPPMNGSDQ